MSSIRKIFSQLQNLFRKDRLEDELAAELQFHLEIEISKNIAAGMSPEEARYAALRSFGGVEQVKEECRDMRGVRYVEVVWQDVRHGLRLLIKNPMLVLVATLSLGRTQEIGIRVALGASRAQVLKMVLRDGLVLIGIGTGIGLVVAFIATRPLVIVLAHGISPTDLVTFVTVTLLLALVGTGACLLPARRAAKVEPMVALRYE